MSSLPFIQTIITGMSIAKSIIMIAKLPHIGTKLSHIGSLQQLNNSHAQYLLYNSNIVLDSIFSSIIFSLYKKRERKIKPPNEQPRIN